MVRSLMAVAVLVGMTGPAIADDVRPLKMEAVDQVVEKHDRSVQACARGGHKDTKAVLLRLEIDPDGHVLTAESSAEKAPAEAACLARVVRKMKFPKAGVVSHVEFPFLLVPQLRR
jgi:hypothetical protein